MFNQTTKQAVSGVVCAQVLYELRDEIGFCSGTDLHEFFNDVLGKPSPSGYEEIPSQAAYDLVCNSAVASAWNNGGNWQYYIDAEVIARKKFNPVDTGSTHDYYQKMRARYESI